MKPSKIVRRGAALLLFCVWTGSVTAADSQLRLEAGNVDWRGGARGAYGVFDSSENAQTVYFKVRLTGDPCPFFVTFGSPGGIRAAGRARRRPVEL
jgi:hypothetical protein